MLWRDVLIKKSRVVLSWISGIFGLVTGTTFIVFAFVQVADIQYDQDRIGIDPLPITSIQVRDWDAFVSAASFMWEGTALMAVASVFCAWVSFRVYPK